MSCHREFPSFTGKYKSVPISALSSGIGPACMAIVVNEVSRIGVHTLIRTGSTDAIQRDIDCGDVTISSVAVRFDRTSNCYITPEYPAVANYEVLLALIEAAESLSISNYHVGIKATTADFYGGQSRPVAKTYGQMENLLSALQEAGTLNLDGDSDALQLGKPLWVKGWLRLCGLRQQMLKSIQARGRRRKRCQKCK